ncbi:MAG TPA: sugar nucleotide-binding protein [Stellaceae bacterium]|nr:sugar nucleotide-binding protein [Stellaceae bacterium]
MSRKFLIVGGDSEIAGAAAAYLRGRGHEVLATTRRENRVAADRPYLDLAQPASDWPIPAGIDAACLCAAVARLNDCARDPAGSGQVNVTGIATLSDRLLARGIPVLFLSTDKVFDGSRPHVPADAPPCPVSEYGRQKAAAEAALAAHMPRGEPAAILRLAKIVSPGMDLLRGWIAALGAGKPIRAFHDMHMAPTPVALVAQAIERLLADPGPGIYQLTGPRDMAYSAVALHLAQKLGADAALVEQVGAASAGLPPGSTAPHTTLDSSALRERFGIVVPDAIPVIDALFDTCR